ncbi:anchored repeat-type ABC transporter ATP-binding subunit [Corynebacterium pseudodiphtheriticum]|jgi:anchored repeat-type ABC transporter, ATP-binding subunit|uniref:anchored repeat-type ABC transporter ATP-binding subunit n=1 Tax=Corynebacterium pseudodiphtheriticum TaxID=37637 RepID=UPI0025429D6A|nr:anchored repeat-type ABC transporter ATP-binding subunit [Corynebacterium pseudodiphtheriticum]MDK4283668.1 anchored repeat-type ABC transporter ATP-binding subunit [Corynebacterium pseudodiphtheriticum]
MHPLISVDKLQVFLGGRQVISDAAIEIASGEFIGLLGPNGAGKTTFMRSILGLVPVKSGNVQVNASIGYVPQRHDVAWEFPWNVRKTVLSGRTGLIGWFRRPGAEDHDAVEAALELTNLQDLAQRPIAELSGGQRQRVLLARALATRPEVLFLDEPFTGLDAPNTEGLLELFEQLSTQGTSIVMSSHNLAEAVHTCHRVVLFNKGIMADGPADEIRANPQIWSETFAVAPSSPLLSAIGVGANA